MNYDSVLNPGGRIMQSHEQDMSSVQTDQTLENIMWTKPAATEMRFGFEVTMYVMNK